MPHSFSLNIAITAWNKEALRHYEPVVASILKFHPCTVFYAIVAKGLDVVSFRAFVEARGGVLTTKEERVPLSHELRPQDSMFLKLYHLVRWKHLDSLVQIDNDVLVRAPLDELFTLAVPGEISGVADCESGRRLTGINTGVIAFRPNTLSISEDELHRWIDNYDPKCDGGYWRDQFLINVHCKTRCIDNKWNWQCMALKNYDAGRKLCEDPVIVHWNGHKKPWRCETWCGSEAYLAEYRRVLATLHPEPVTLCYSVNNAKWTEYAVTSAWSAARHTPRPIILRNQHRAGGKPSLACKPPETRVLLSDHGSPVDGRNAAGC
ncbi:MAG: hypothetical protein LBS59_08260 [Puniceicoccales bacterium]|jgi:hypothetical protein|nr:hypothetical protein [Puniceicoccales bacterium]